MNVGLPNKHHCAGSFSKDSKVFRNSPYLTLGSSNRQAPFSRGILFQRSRKKKDEDPSFVSAGQRYQSVLHVNPV